MGKIEVLKMRGRAWILTVLVSLFLSLIPVALGGCLTNSDCGSESNVQPGLCLGAEGICQCGFGYQGNAPLQPTECIFNCTPKEISSSGFLNELDVNITVQENQLILSVQPDPYAEQEPAKHPNNSTRNVALTTSTGKTSLPLWRRRAFSSLSLMYIPLIWRFFKSDALHSHHRRGSDK